MRIGFLCKHNPFDRNAFSGTAYFAHTGLRRLPGCEVRPLGGHRRVDRLGRIGRRLGRVLTPPGPKITAEEFKGLDVVVSLVSTELIPIAAGLTDAPVIHVTDATPGFLRDFYGWDVPEAKDALERRALEAATLTIYSSQYMAERAVAEFGGRFADKVDWAPFGVNLDDLPEAPASKPPLSPLNLLFVGKNWERKGGAVALAAQTELRRRGIDARLTLIGAAPDEARRTPSVEALGFLDKNKPAQFRRLRRAFAEAHVFVLPTRADCTPMVVAEANSYATPVLITETGGIGSLLRPGTNGFMLPPGATGEEYADRILALARDPASYAALSASSFAQYRDVLNWDAWARRVLEICSGLSPSPETVRAGH